MTVSVCRGEDRERLMEPYVTHKPKGTGLGLAIVKKIMEDHGGQVCWTTGPTAQEQWLLQLTVHAREPEVAPEPAGSPHGA